MSDIAVTDLTVTLLDKTVIGRRRRLTMTISFGNSTLTYPTDGIPVTAAALGFRRNIASLTITGSRGDGILYNWDESYSTIRAFYPTQETGSSSSRAGAEFTGGSTAPAATVLDVEAEGW